MLKIKDLRRKLVGPFFMPFRGRYPSVICDGPLSAPARRSPPPGAAQRQDAPRFVCPGAEGSSARREARGREVGYFMCPASLAGRRGWPGGVNRQGRRMGSESNSRAVRAHSKESSAHQRTCDAHAARARGPCRIAGARRPQKFIDPSAMDKNGRAVQTDRA
jgi:hypothetical protein